MKLPADAAGHEWIKVSVYVSTPNGHNDGYGSPWLISSDAGKTIFPTNDLAAGIGEAMQRMFAQLVFAAWEDLQAKDGKP